MFRSCLTLLAVVAVTAYPADWVCVRNYVNKAGLIPCDRWPQFYAYVIPAEHKEQKVCTRMYASLYCSQSKAYQKVETLEGKSICVLDNNQKHVANFCQSLPQYYSYVLRRLPDDFGEEIPH